jgi:transposase
MSEGKPKTCEGQVVYCGIDTHQKSWKVAILKDGHYEKTFGQEPNVGQLANYLEHNYPGAKFKLGYEAGFCGFWIAKDFKSLGMECLVLHAADIPTSDKDRRQKTDTRDCRKIAEYLTNPKTESIHIPDLDLQQARSVVRTRTRISRDVTRVRNEIRGHLQFYGLPLGKNMPKKWTKEFIGQLRQWSIDYSDVSLGLLLDEMTVLQDMKSKAYKEVRNLSRHGSYKTQFDLLTSIPGMGLLHSMNFLTEMGDIKRFKTLDKLCNMVGLIPNTNSSGEKPGIGRMTKRGKTQVKSSIIEASWVAIRHDPELKEYFATLSQRMQKNKAIIRVARKLLNRIRTVLIKGKPYQVKTELKVA